MEEKIIPDYPTYSITNTGFVRDLRTGTLSNGHCHEGYRAINLTNFTGKKSFCIHRLVAVAFIENPGNLDEVDHINRIRHDNDVKNLRWANNFLQAQNRGDTKNRIGYKNICFEDNYYRVVMTRDKKIIARKRFQNLNDAIVYRDYIYSTL